jgi:hypothetical protein
MGEYSWGSGQSGGGTAGGLGGGTPVNFKIDPTHTYTVPSGKVLSGHASATSGTVSVLIGAVQVGAVTAAADQLQVYAVAGDAFSTASITGSYGVSALLFDA